MLALLLPGSPGGPGIPLDPSTVGPLSPLSPWSPKSRGTQKLNSLIAGLGLSLVFDGPKMIPVTDVTL